MAKSKKQSNKKPDAPLLKCEHCDKTFKRASGLTVHVKTQHPETQLSEAGLLVYRMGRPSSYKPEYAVQLIEHMMVDKFEKETIEEEIRYSPKTGIKVSEKRKFKMIPNDLPTLEGFARKIGVTYRTLLNWSEAVEDDTAEVPVYKYPDFFQAYNIAKQLQKEFLIDNGLKGNYPPAAYIFTAKNVTDMTDRQIIETEDAQFKDKEDALDKWFDTLRDNAKSTRGDTATEQDAPKDVQA